VSETDLPPLCSATRQLPPARVQRKALLLIGAQPRGAPANNTVAH